MSNKPGLFNLSVWNILSDEQSILEQARIRMLYYGLFLAFIALFAISLNVYFQHQGVFISLAVGLLVCVSLLFKYLTWKPRLAFISHTLLCISLAVNLLNIFIVIQRVDVVAILVIILSILFSYYMLGQRWGLIYSLANVLPAILFMVLAYSNNYVIALTPQKIDQSTFIISILANFIMIIYICSHFYNAYVKNIRELNEISTEHGRLNLDYETALLNAKKLAQAKSEFLSVMSHEIRTPLNAVIGITNLLRMSDPRPDQADNLDILKFSANNLLAIINDVLDFNKIESGGIEFEKVGLNLIDLMTNICGGQIIAAENKGLVFHLDIDSRLKEKTLFGDPTRIAQIIFNLVNNAVKFTHNGDIWVTVTSLSDRHNMLTINFSVRDTGIGIPKAAIETIFEPFAQQSTSTTRQYSGIGLGLAIVKRLLELQKIPLHVRSAPGEGSEFAFNMNFPVSTEKFILDTVAIHPFVHSGPLSGVQVLVAEDNPVNVMLMKKLFSRWNITPTFAENGERAVELVQYGNFNIVLMDLQMPVMNGFDATIEIRKLADPKKANVPIIALTASALLDIKERVYKAGMNDYMAKPFKPDELKDKISLLVEAAVAS